MVPEKGVRISFVLQKEAHGEVIGSEGGLIKVEMEDKSIEYVLPRDVLAIIGGKKNTRRKGNRSKSRRNRK